MESTSVRTNLLSPIRDADRDRDNSHDEAIAESVTIVDTMLDSQLFGRWFPRIETWASWVVFLKAVFGLEMERTEEELFHRFTGRVKPPEKVKEGWLVVGRRGGKSLIAALCAMFLACFRSYREHLAPGEVATIMVIAADRKQARTIMGYVRGFLEEVPMLRRMVVTSTKESIELSNRVTIEIHTSSFRSVRGYTLAAVICDEIAFWRSEDSANPDREILAAIRPGMATIPGALLLCLSSPYARRGALWETRQKYYGKEDNSILVWQAPTEAMNPTVPRSVIEQAYEEDPVSAASEYGAEFRSDIESYVRREAVDAVVETGRYVRPYTAETGYRAFVDPSGGIRDSMTLAIAHYEDGRAVLDLILEVRPPFSPEDAVRQFCEVLLQYGCSSVVGDRYGGEWTRQRFREHGIHYKVGDRTKNEIYGELLPAINSRRVELLDDTRLVNQLCNLERRTARGGRDSIDHPPGGHDDLINAAGGALLEAIQAERRWLTADDLGIS